MRIDVIQDEIDKGIRRESGLCPIALATKRITGISVNIGLKYMDGPDWCIRLPAIASAFTIAFDEGLSVKPFAFDLDIPTS